MEWHRHINREGTLQLPQPSENAPSSTLLHQRRWPARIGLCVVPVDAQGSCGRGTLPRRLDRDVPGYAGTDRRPRANPSPASKRYSPVASIRARSTAHVGIACRHNPCAGNHVPSVGPAARRVWRRLPPPAWIRPVRTTRRYVERPGPAGRRNPSACARVGDVSRQRLLGRNAVEQRGDLRESSPVVNRHRLDKNGRNTMGRVPKVRAPSCSTLLLQPPVKPYMSGCPTPPNV